LKGAMMQMIDARCGWNFGKGTPEDLDGLHVILMCAAKRGCSRCVECSEKALELVLAAAGKSDRMPKHSAGAGQP
jgi:hypothetical protein